MGAGPLVVTYRLTGRSRAIIEQELGGTAEAIYLVDLPPADRAHALGRAGAVLSHDTSKELRTDEIPLIRNARLLQFTAAGVDWVPTRDLPEELPVAANKGGGAEPMAEHSRHWRWLRQSGCSSSTPTSRAANSTRAGPTECCAAACAASSALAMSDRRVVGGAGAAWPIRDALPVSRPPKRDRLAAQFCGWRGMA
jgi:hypothetical protein